MNYETCFHCKKDIKINKTRRSSSKRQQVVFMALEDNWSYVNIVLSFHTECFISISGNDYFDFMNRRMEASIDFKDLSKDSGSAEGNKL